MLNYNNFIFIGKEQGPQKRGAYTVAKRFAEKNNFKFKNDYKLKDSEINKYDKMF